MQSKIFQNKYSIGKIIIISFLILIFFPAVIILLSGNFLWIEGWILSIWFDAMMLINIIYMYKKNPELISERLSAHGSQNQEKWDKYLLKLLFVLSSFWIISMPIDAQRLKWSADFPQPVKIFGMILLIPSFYLLIRATIDNPYLSTVVRIQTDRKQKVVTTGSYSIVRHPQYLGIILLIMGSPLLLNSIIGLLLGSIIVVIIIIRLLGEENMLVKSLDGYAAYKQKVKFRLLPFLW